MTEKVAGMTEEGLGACSFSSAQSATVQADSVLLGDHLFFCLCGALLEEGAGDDLAVYLAGSLAYLVDLDLPPVAGHGACLHEAFSAPDLDGPIRGAFGGLGGEDLGHAGLPSEGPALVPEPGGLQHHVEGDPYLHAHVG